MLIRLRSLSRWKAAAIHVCLSLAVAAAVAALVFLLWYPPDLVKVTGGLTLFAILMSVDVTLGPMMTLIVFNPAKKALKFDLAVIALLQLGALGYGLYVVSEARPVYVVFVIDRFEVVTAAEIPQQELARVQDPYYRSVPWLGPRYVAAEKPADAGERNRILFASLQGIDLQQFPQYYVPYASQARLAAEKAQPIENLVKNRADRKSAVAAFLSERALTQGSVAYLPLHSRNQDASIILRKQTGEILGVLPINPWG